ncbi:MAG TPA: hypothetical protein VHM65_07250 [Candidatus Lustribacter sp.]|nr:hypothetical protein [Candidatus Lustribacter sp.]
MERAHDPGAPRWARALAAGGSLVQAGALGALIGLYLLQMAAGADTDRGRAVMSVVLFVVLAAGLVVLGVAAWRSSGWPRTPILVWNALLVPVAISLGQSRQLLGALALGIVVLVTVVGTLSLPSASEVTGG